MFIRWKFDIRYASLYKRTNANGGNRELCQELTNGDTLLLVSLVKHRRDLFMEDIKGSLLF